jgi:putative nucleotidyltransferase with HDIG domain
VSGLGRLHSRRGRRLRFDVEAAARGPRRGVLATLTGRRLPQTLTAVLFLALQVAVVTAGLPGLGAVRFLGVAGLVLAAHALLGWYLSIEHRDVLRDLRGLLLLEGVTLIALALGKLVLALGWPPYLLPLPVFTVALAVGQGRRIAVLWALLVTPVYALMAGLHATGAPVLHQPTLITLTVGGLVAVLAVHKVSRRSKVVAAGFYSGLAQAAAILVCEFLLGEPGRAARLTGDAAMHSWLLVSFGLLNGMFSGYFLAEVGLRLVESTFDVVTDIRLQELADLNQPILKKLAMEAPGTFHHSQMVGMLAEAGAEAIGANALLCRVGCHFHDLGKLAKPEYYVENLRGEVSKHTGLTPTMSTLIVISHVKDGVEMAKELGLPSRVIDFIPEHHGTIAVEFFYRQAVERREEEGGPPINKDDFRYPGPRPRSRETAIVMVADAAEAISRALDEPNPARIDGMVRDVIMRRLHEGQFDECGVTLAELMQAKNAMVRVLLAAHHGRIKYPKPPENELVSLGLTAETAWRIAAQNGEAGDEADAGAGG